MKCVCNVCVIENTKKNRFEKDKFQSGFYGGDCWT